MQNYEAKKDICLTERSEKPWFGERILQILWVKYMSSPSCKVQKLTQA